MECLSCIIYECLDVVHEKKNSRYVNSVSRLYLHPRDTSLKLNLPFDICRWLVKGKDVKVVKEVLAKHHLYLTSRPLLRHRN